MPEVNYKSGEKLMDVNFDIIYVKKILFYSAIFGAVLAIAALIPQIMPAVTLFIIPFLCAPLVLSYTLYKKEFENKNAKECAVYGGIAGIISGFSFLIIFCPLVLLIHLIFKSYYTYMLQYLNFFLTVVLIITVAVIYGITNAATGLLAGFLITAIDTKNK